MTTQTGAVGIAHAANGAHHAGSRPSLPAAHQRTPDRLQGGRVSVPISPRRPLLLDLFCGAGGAAVGYHRAGFDVVGVDLVHQPRYPFEFIQADAITFLDELNGTFGRAVFGYEIHAIHASPPCQDHSALRSRAGRHGTGWMLAETLRRLAAQPAIWVVENVSTAHNRADLRLCGEMFGLRTVRHRRFTIDTRLSALLAVPAHPRHRRPTSTKNRVSALAEGHNLSITGNVGVHAGPLCMGIDWMTGDELSQAIPPAYTQFIGEQLLAATSALADSGPGS
jgi:DNA (cytosine-5)-methyltransferase 1